MRLWLLLPLLLLAPPSEGHETIRLQIQDIPVSFMKRCIGPHRDSCTKSRLPAADWALAHDGRAISMECLVHVDRIGDEITRIGCAIPWRGSSRTSRIDFDLTELGADGIRDIEARCLDARWFPSDGIVEDNSDWARRATQHNAIIDGECTAELTATLHIDPRLGERDGQFVLRDVEIDWLDQ